MFDKKPTTWLENWSEDGTDITIPLATFPEMTAAEADATDGDIRKVLYAICEKLWSKWLATAQADRPTKMTVSRNSVVDETTGVITKNYFFQFKTTVTGEEVASET
jgi:hypothetical protein